MEKSRGCIFMQRCLTVPHISSQAIPRRLNKKFDEEKAGGKTLEENVERLWKQNFQRFLHIIF
jgi:hypothetical protein